jgi:hypothetical protein
VDEDAARDADVLSATAVATRDQNAGIGSGSLASRLTPDNRFFSGTGISSASAVSTVGQSQSHASSAALLRFSIDQAYVFDFSGIFSPINGFWEASLRHSPFSPSDTPFFSYGSEAPGTPHAFGRLLPGLYDFEVGTQTSAFVRGIGADQGASPFAFSFSLTPQSQAPVPEPTTLLLLGTGAAGMILRRRFGHRAGQTNAETFEAKL